MTMPAKRKVSLGRGVALLEEAPADLPARFATVATLPNKPFPRRAKRL
jgi:hypothetical protein